MSPLIWELVLASETRSGEPGEEIRFGVRAGMHELGVSSGGVNVDGVCDVISDVPLAELYPPP